eukprot:scaffold766_cov560-Prasinococcus_capsulatus_cf.AAC.1
MGAWSWLEPRRLALVRSQTPSDRSPKLPALLRARVPRSGQVGPVDAHALNPISSVAGTPSPDQGTLTTENTTLPHQPDDWSVAVFSLAVAKRHNDPIRASLRSRRWAGAVTCALARLLANPTWATCAACVSGRAGRGRPSNLLRDTTAPGTAPNPEVWPGGRRRGRGLASEQSSSTCRLRDQIPERQYPPKPKSRPRS